jgi:hypothetical protein
MEPASQRDIIEVDEGLFLISYTSAEDMERPPVVKIFPAKPNDQNVTLILHPDQQEAALWQPGSTLVVRASGAATLLIEVSPDHPG